MTTTPLHDHLDRCVRAVNARDWSVLTELYAATFAGTDHRSGHAESLSVAAVVTGWRMHAEIWPDLRLEVVVDEASDTAFHGRFRVRTDLLSPSTIDQLVVRAAIRVGADGRAEQLAYLADGIQAHTVFTTWRAAAATDS